MLRKRYIAAVAVAALVLLTVTGCYRHTPEQRAEYMISRIAKELSLNDVQKAKLDKIKDEFLARRGGMATMREDTVKEANELMRSTEIDKARLNALVEKTQAHANDTIRFVTEKFTEIHDMLTPEQREKLVKDIEEFTHGHHK